MAKRRRNFSFNKLKKRTQLPSVTAADTKPSLPQPTQYCASLHQWQVLEEAVVGLAHREHTPPLPCQDAVAAVQQPRPTLVLADGAGSAAVSELGAQTVVRTTIRLLNTLEQQVAMLLDNHELPTTINPQHLALLIVKHAKGTLQDLANQQRREIRDFRCTLLVLVLGKERFLWLKVGDGALVVEKIKQTSHSCATSPQLIPELEILGTAGKGEYANQTTFIDDQLSISDVQSGLVASQHLTGAVAMSDGAAEKLVAQDHCRTSGLLSHWLDQLRVGKLRRRTLTSQFYEESFCKNSSGDDRCIALAATAFALPTSG